MHLVNEAGFGLDRKLDAWPDEFVRLAQIAQAKGIRVLEAPVTGGVHLAARGEITVLAGGERRCLTK